MGQAMVAPGATVGLTPLPIDSVPVPSRLAPGASTSALTLVAALTVCGAVSRTLSSETLPMGIEPAYSLARSRGRTPVAVLYVTRLFVPALAPLDALIAPNA